jgi:predicted Ser/Thr protein kinase
VDWRELNLLEKIGSGGFGDIFRSTWRGTTVACKMIRSDMIDKEKKAAMQDFR